MKYTLLLVICFNTITISFAKSLTHIVGDSYPSDCKVAKETKYFGKPIRGLKYIIRYIVNCPNTVVSTVYIESHIVRTMKQVLLIDIKTNKVSRVQTLLFNEPSEYKAKTDWLGRFVGRKHPLSTQLDGISGATLTANAVKEGISRMLEVHSGIQE